MSRTTSTKSTVDRYFDVVSDGPLIIVRMPCTRREYSDGLVSVKAAPRWRDVLKSIGAVMRSHGFRLKNVYAIDLIAPAAETPKFEAQWREHTDRINLAFGGNPNVCPEFWLYEWKNNEFALVRTGATTTKEPS